MLSRGTSQAGSHSTGQPSSSCFDWRHSAQNALGTRCVEGSWFLAPCRHGLKQQQFPFCPIQHRILRWILWLMPITPVPTRPRQKRSRVQDQLGVQKECKVDQRYTIIPCLKKKKVSEFLHKVLF